MSIQRVETADDWEVVAWLWQLFRYDMSRLVGGSGLPRANGRYSTRDLDPAPGSFDHAGYVWWETSEHGPSPAGFAVVAGLLDERRTIAGFWVAPAQRRSGVGSRLAQYVIQNHTPPWSIGFQHTNHDAGTFWRTVATEAFGAQDIGWVEIERPVPDKPDVPPDHWIETL